MSSPATIVSKSRLLKFKAVLIKVGAVNPFQVQPQFFAGANLIIVGEATNYSTSSQLFPIANSIAVSFFKIDPG